MKKIISLLTVAILLVCALTGCGGNKEAVATDGSTSMNKVISALGEAFQSDTGITVTYNATGSGAGIQAVQEGRCDIGLSSRNLKDEEKANGLEETILAYDGIAIIVNPINPVANLDVETIAKIYTGEITNWKEVGGNDAEIVLIGREAGSGTRDGFESITDTEDKCKYRQELTSTGDVITTVASNPAAIGYASLASIKDTVKALTVDGVSPSEKTIKDHRLNNTNANLYRENERLSNINDRLTDENSTLWAENKDFRLLRKVFGSQQIDALISQAKEQEQQRKHTKQPSNQRTKRIRNNDFER